jgi:hypothetical protein
MSTVINVTMSGVLYFLCSFPVVPSFYYCLI